MAGSLPGLRGLSDLKRLALRPAPAEHCGLCNVTLGSDHRHLVEPASRRLECACTACALLFENQTGRFRLVPRDATMFRNFVLHELQWEALGLPINLAFLFENSALGKTTAFYPSPAGATESLLPLETWQEIVAQNPRLKRMQADVEALLVNRIRDNREYFIAPIDRCYELVGIIRRYWRGFSGGDEVSKKIDDFFSYLRTTARMETADA